MAVPDFQSLIRPILEFASDSKPHDNGELVEHVSQVFELSEEDRNEMLPSGTQKRVNNRVGWAKTHLKHAGLVRHVKHGVLEITSEGLRFLERHRGPINLRVLDDIQAHSEWFHASKDQGAETPLVEESEATPEERIESLVDALDKQLASELLEGLREGDAYRFERVVLDVLLALGYGGSRKEAATVTRKSNDEGIDGVINEDRLGLDVIYVQAKRWAANNIVGRKEVQAFVGALAGKRASKGVFITTSGFNKNATSYASTLQQRVILIDGARLASLMIDNNIGVSVAHTYHIKRIDADYFEDA